MTVGTDLERPCTPRKRLELAKEVDRETAELLDKPATTKPTPAPATPRGGLRDFCESFVGVVVKQASQRFS